MPSKAELMASSLPAVAASKIGYDIEATATAAGTTQGTATTLVGNFVNVTTSSIGAGVVVPTPTGRTYIYNSGPNTLLVYPPIGGTIVGLAQNAAVNVAPLSGVSVEGDGVNFAANISI